jgi:hypothetical protein
MGDISLPLFAPDSPRLGRKGSAVVGWAPWATPAEVAEVGME